MGLSRFPADAGLIPLAAQGYAQMAERKPFRDGLAQSGKSCLEAAFAAKERP